MTTQLTPDQQTVSEQFALFCATAEPVFVLQGSAGTGKTTLVQHLLEHVLPRFQLKALGVAPTHKAKRVLRARMPNTSVITMASLLAKMRNHSYIGAHSFSEGSDERLLLHTHTCFVLDEASMVSDADFGVLKRAAKSQGNRILAIGDPYQIPAISQPLYIQEGLLRRRPCAVFRDAYPSGILTQIVRQTTLSPILEVADYLRQHLHEDSSLRTLFPKLVISRLAVYDLFRQEGVKMIAYTNEAVNAHNQAVRLALGREQLFETGDLLMGYQNIGYPNLTVENGAEYRVLVARAETNGLERSSGGIGRRRAPTMALFPHGGRA